MGKAVTILIADDEPHINRSLAFILKQEGYKVVIAHDGGEAWRKITQGVQPEIVFLDVMMPQLTGFEVCERIKSNKRFKQIYVLLLTAKWQEADQRYAKEIGADEYITKPFSPSHIIRRVREILSERLGVANEKCV